MSWPLPLSRDTLRQAAKNPVPQPMPTAAKRAAEEAKLPAGLQGPVRPRIVAPLLFIHDLVPTVDAVQSCAASRALHVYARCCLAACCGCGVAVTTCGDHEGVGVVRMKRTVWVVAAVRQEEGLGW